mgnify:CR=1 FL=1
MKFENIYSEREPITGRNTHRSKADTWAATTKNVSVASYSEVSETNSGRVSP